MIFHWPQIVMVVLLSIEVGVAVACHGKPRGLHSVWWKIFDAAILVWILSAGGFFRGFA